MQQQILCSIIIPTLNEAEALSQLLKQLSATTQAYTIIIADGDSSDATLDVAKQYGALIVECNHVQRAYQLNKAAKIATTPYLFFAHADSILPHNFDAVLTTAIEQKVKAACFRLRFDWPHWFLTFNAWFTRFNSSFFRYGDQGLLVERNTFFLAGGYDEQLDVLEDQEITRRLKRLVPFKVFKAEITTSARKYRKYGVYRLQRLFVKLTVMYYLGASQKTLMRWYQKVLAKPLK